VAVRLRDGALERRLGLPFVSIRTTGTNDISIQPWQLECMTSRHGQQGRPSAAREVRKRNNKRVA
jgi:hypothetical protein